LTTIRIYDKHNAAFGNCRAPRSHGFRALFDIVNELRRARFIARPRPWYAANRLHCEMEAAVALASMRGHVECAAEADFGETNPRCGNATSSRHVGLAPT